jgi:hypothetical protein
MQSPYSFIVTPVNNRRYANIKKIGKVDFFTSTSEEDHTASNRYATVVSLPINYKGEIKKGDTLLVHHNVFKFYNDMYGRRKSGKSFFKDDLFFVDYDQFFLYQHNNVWKAHDKYCFVKPIKIKEKFLNSGSTEEPLMGTIKYINNQLLKLGLKEGDEISFQPESEYEFKVEGEKLYRMFTNNITLNFGQ